MQTFSTKKFVSAHQNASNTWVSEKVLGSGARGAPPCLFVSTEHTKYIFNCGEGTQRLANEHHLKITKLEHVFVTSATWKNLGGLPGMLLTLQDTGLPELFLHGPEGTFDLLEAGSKFIDLRSMKLSPMPMNEFKPYTDHLFNIWYVPISKVSKEDEEIVSEPVDNTNCYASTKNINGKRGLSEQEDERQIIKGQKKLKRITDVMCYVCKTSPRLGSLCLNKCVEFGVTPGPHFGQLKAGHDITLPDGRIIFSKDVCLPKQPGDVFLVVECPTEDYLDCFVNHPAFVRHQDNASVQEEKAFCVFHFTPEKVLNNEKYKEWMKKFASSTQHIVLNDGNYCMGTEAIHKNQYQLNLLHPEIFPILSEDSFKKQEKEKNEDLNIHYAKTLHSLHLRPQRGLSTTNDISLQPQLYVDEVLAIEGIPAALAELQLKIKSQNENTTETDEYPRIVMLGTGSSIPNKSRNTSGILLRVDEKHSILLDCSEGTFGQILRLYGNSETDNILSTIKAIYISHLHTDHHIGLITILQERSKLTNDPVYLLVPEPIAAWLRFYHNRFEPILNLLNLIWNKTLLLKTHTLHESKKTELYNSLNLKEINTVHVRHCSFSYGVSFTLHNGKKIVYSGDTMPCNNLVSLGKDCDLLIHEATMEDKLENEARYKLHSTTSQAIEIGNKMNSKFILLTHFSQRYCKISEIPNVTNVGVAYDNMEMKLSQLKLLPFFSPFLRLLYNEYYVAMEERASRKQNTAESLN